MTYKGFIYINVTLSPHHGIDIYNPADPRATNYTTHN